MCRITSTFIAYCLVICTSTPALPSETQGDNGPVLRETVHEQITIWKVVSADKKNHIYKYISDTGEHFTTNRPIPGAVDNRPLREKHPKLDKVRRYCNFLNPIVKFGAAVCQILTYVT